MGVSWSWVNERGGLSARISPQPAFRHFTFGWRPTLKNPHQTPPVSKSFIQDWEPLRHRHGGKGGRVAQGGYPPRAPTDPDLPN